jgi:cbb3-type cytochrome oxidase subunit 3
MYQGRMIRSELILVRGFHYTAYLGVIFLIDNNDNKNNNNNNNNTILNENEQWEKRDF